MAKPRRQERRKNFSNIIRLFYPEQYSLKSYLEIIDDDGCFQLIDESDSKEYLDVLKKTVVAVPKESVNQPVSFNLKRCLSLRNIVLDVIENVRVIKSSKSKENVLAFGYEAVGEHNKQGTVYGYPTLKNTYINSAMDFILSKPWQLLHERIGDDVMFHLLTRVAMFLKMPSRCFFQISGYPITMSSALAIENLKAVKPTELSVRDRKIGKRKRDDLETSAAPTCNGQMPKAKRRNVYDEESSAQTLDSCQSSVSQKRKAESLEKLCPLQKKMKKLAAFRRRGIKKQIFHLISLPGLFVYHKGRPKLVKKFPGQNSRPKKKNIKAKVKPRKNLTATASISWHKKFFPRSSLFFSLNFEQKLPSNHILECLQASKTAAKKLIQTIFLESENKKHRQKARKTRLSRRYINMIPLFCDLIKGHMRCSFRNLLKQHCPYKKTDLIKIKRKVSCHKKAQSKGERRDRNKFATSEEEKKVIYQHAVHNYSSHLQVMSFIRTVCNKVVPLKIWGNKRNRNQFYKNFGSFLRLNKGEKFHMAQMMDGIQVSQCCWLKSDSDDSKSTPLTESLKRKEILGKFVWWLVCKYLTVILKSFFYITETQMSRNKVLYFRQPVWRKIFQYGQESLENSVVAQSDAQRIVKNSPKEFCLLRFVPKARKVRPIINMKHGCIASDVDGMQSVPVNWKFNDIFKILTFEKENNPTALGSSLFGVDDLYKKLRKFVIKRQETNDSRLLFFAHVDITDCYESIIQEKLCKIMESVLQEDQYYIRQFHVMRISSTNEIKKHFTKQVSNDEDSDMSFIEFLNNEIAQSRLKDTVVVDYTRHITKESESVVEQLRKHVQECVVKVGKKFYHKTRGIPQGSCASTLFCNYYYGNMEKDYFQDISSNEDTLLLRWVDDFLVITPHIELAKKFLQRMHSGIPEYGVLVNTEKSLVNFDAKTPDGAVVKKVGMDEKFPWCGFLLDQQTLNVQCDYSKYEGCHVNDTVITELSTNPGIALKRKLRYMLNSKCHPLLLDSQINTKEAVLVNMYQTFLSTACKFNAQARRLPRGHRPPDNPAFFVHLILDLPKHVFRLVSRRFSKLSQSQSQFAVNSHVVHTLCFRAFHVCLKRKQSQYKEVLKYLERALRRLKGRLNKKQIRVINQCQNDVIKHLL